jgi:hypothetical protein
VVEGLLPPIAAAQHHHPREVARVDRTAASALSQGAERWARARSSTTEGRGIYLAERQSAQARRRLPGVEAAAQRRRPPRSGCMRRTAATVPLILEVSEDFRVDFR